MSSYFYAYLAAFDGASVGDQSFSIMLAFEIVFVLSMGFKFLCEFLKDGHNTPIRDLSEIASRYFNSDFIWDIIPLIPFPFIFDFGGRETHLNMIKCIRMLNGFRIFNIQNLMWELRNINRIRLENVIKRDPVLAENKLLDQNKISD